jgi:gluconolactonase
MFAHLHSARCSGFILGGFVLFAADATGAVQFQVSDPVEFAKIIDTNAVFTTNIANLNTLIEGPVWIPDGQYLVFSEVGSNRLMKLVLPNTLTDVLSLPAGAKYNGNVLDLQERLISCECGNNGFKVVMTTNGVIVPLVTNCSGLKFISPNDACVKSDGSIWFTDTGSDSGIALGTPGYQTGYYVYRFYETNGDATVLPVITNNLQRPNGICLSPDETKLYVADDGTSWNRRTIMVYDVTSSNTLTGGRTFCTATSGFVDGIRCDVDGRIWAAAGDGVEIFAPDGHLIGTIKMSNRPSNLCFGGPQYKALFTVGQPNVCSFPVLVAGAVSIKKLSINSNEGNPDVTWPAPSTGYQLQAADSLGDGAVWSDVTEPPSATNGLNHVDLAPTNDARFFRLRLN